ncbi:RNA polymerase sigma-I factor [Marinisporobacter balticus]|uniref:RNA polymerase sigma factor SigI n=1 Tax=Marinisporobacter balticus TaxID=2018667 RepID=A0A4R2L1H6_9FIRM|nr:RNA polymerase sigma-I factor [Marinisporobacter balticus]TCO76408.1 RNA polymerase sigma factor [Marinisporobacter balticus]
MARLLNFFQINSLTAKIEKIKKGDTAEREKMIEDYIPFIIKTVSDKLNKYIESENSEEFSVGIEAFNEVIDKYEASRGSFIGFAEIVIKNRVTDYLRKNSKHRKNIPISQFEEDENGKLQKHFAVEDFTESFAMKTEIQELEDVLKDFKITFYDLVQEAPKHMDTRANGIRIAKYISESKELKEELFRKKSLPSKKLINALDSTAKILKRSRKFIIATVIILDRDLEKLRNYIESTKGGAEGGL